MEIGAKGETMTKVRSIGVFSAAKINGLLYGILGLLLAPFVLLGPFFSMLGGDGAKRGGFGGAIFVAVLLPIFYGVIGFLFGAVLAFIYNAISHAIGGLEIELESPAPALTNRPPALSPTSLVLPPSDLPPPNLPPPSPP